MIACRRLGRHQRSGRIGPADHLSDRSRRSEEEPVEPEDAHLDPGEPLLGQAGEAPAGQADLSRAKTLTVLDNVIVGRHPPR